jgi:hypothetical protein
LVAGNISRVADAADAKAMCRRLDEARILGSVGTHLMVQMGHAELQVKKLAKLPEQVQQDHRIDTARDGDEHGMAALEHLIVLDSLSYPVKEGVHSPGAQGDRVG